MIGNECLRGVLLLDPWSARCSGGGLCRVAVIRRCIHPRHLFPRSGIRVTSLFNPDPRIISLIHRGTPHANFHNRSFVKSLDDAGARRGRIDLKIHVGKPDVEAREAVLEQKLSERDHDVTSSEITWVASRTEGNVAADLEAIVNKAAKRVLTRHGDTVHFEDLEAALNEI